jgi:hypothetical protein
MRVERNQPWGQASKRRMSTRQTEKLISKFDRWMERSGGALVDRFGEETAAVMRGEILDECRSLIRRLPYIGGRRNTYSSDLSFSAWALATYRVMIRHGGSLEDTGELIRDVVRAEIERVPRGLRSLMVSYRFSRLRQQKLQRAARRSQAHRYPGDWVFDRIDGDGKAFDFGIDMTECGIVKFLHAEGADELCPYLCDIDYVSAEAMGVGLRRTKTLAWGCDRCDFRLTKDGDTSAPWPPRFTERHCGERETEEEAAAS